MRMSFFGVYFSAFSIAFESFVGTRPWAISLIFPCFPMKKLVGIALTAL